MMETNLEIIAYPASAGGTHTRVLEAGKGQETVFFLHGVGARADRWRRNLPVVAAAGYRCMAIDLPGHGFARKGVGFNYSVPGYADFAQTFLNENGIGDCHLVGTSMGAHILSTLCCRNRSRVRSLTLVGATGLFPIGAQARERIAARISDVSREGIGRKLAAVVYDSTLVTEAIREEEWRINNSPGAIDSFRLLAEYFRNGLDGDAVGKGLIAQAAGLKHLIVWGEEDRSVPIDIGRSFAAEMNSSLVSIPRTAHVPYWEAPEAFNATLVRFLGSL
ncbi:alpha/beta fold hydrolase [Mesorhizobium sp. VK3E]|uniref:Alpha/beta fold hydrolase n=2 Tax=Mesorhizobium australafricanum TaxID=3072311 RepID=A0ABU4WSG0_9HYPH|nr:alpha/beta fold hydrolase [Mesorhizobium sp. VK3E]